MQQTVYNPQKGRLETIDIDFTDKKRNWVILFGGRPPNPRSLSHSRPKYEIDKSKRPHL